MPTETFLPDPMPESARLYTLCLETAAAFNCFAESYATLVAEIRTTPDRLARLQAPLTKMRRVLEAFSDLLPIQTIQITNDAISAALLPQQQKVPSKNANP